MLKNLPSGVVEGRIEDYTFEDIMKCITILCMQWLRAGDSPKEVWFSVQEGNESALSNEFPQPDLLDQLQQVFHGSDMGEVTSHLHSWEDPACEIEQAAWCIGIKV